MSSSSSYDDQSQNSVPLSSKSGSSQNHAALPSVPYYTLYRYCSRGDVLRLVIGCFLAVLTAFCQPLAFLLFGKFTKAMLDNASNSTSCLPPPAPGETSHFMKKTEEFVVFNTANALAQFIFGYLMVVCFNLVAENQAFKIRVLYFESLIRQDISWFDTHRKRDFSNRIIEDMIKIQEAMSERVGSSIFLFASFIILVCQSFYFGWRLSLVLTMVIPILGGITYFQTKVFHTMTEKEQEAYAEAGSVADEVLSNIRTVVAFNAQEKEIKRYDLGLVKVRKHSLRKACLTGLATGLSWLCCYLNYALAFWYGTILIVDSRANGDGLYGPDTVVVIYYSILVAAFSIGTCSEYFEVFGAGTGAAKAIFNVLDRVSAIDSFSDDGVKPRDRAIGEIEFDNVEFFYPSRPEVSILNKLSFKIRPGQSVALVGQSGCGKSTCAQLLQRFYDVTSGHVKLDGVDICDLNIAWLRSQIGLVSQEPALFNEDILGNITIGKEGSTLKDVENAAKQAYAHDFITKLPMGYRTICGERGAQLSGGQKQRIAIARSLIKNPPILILDEATSALDLQSEAIVQAALERARFGRTTIIIAHRLSTIKAADVVIAINKGTAAEIGTHTELMDQKGLYYKLVMNQAYMEPDHTTASSDRVPTQTDNEDTISDQTCNEDYLIPPHTSHMHVTYQTQKKLKSAETKLLMKGFRLSRLIKLASAEWPFMLCAVLCAILKSANVPIYAIIFGSYLGLFVSKDETEIIKYGNIYALIYVGVGVITGAASFLQKLFSGLAGDRISLRVRRLIFKTLLDQDMTYFDEPENSVGNLTARLSTDATGIQGATSSRLVGLFQATTIVIFSVSLSIYLLPKMGAVIAVFVPISLFSGFLEGKVLGNSNIVEKEAVETSAKIATEALNNIRTVASLGVEKRFIQSYTEALMESHKINIRRAHIRAAIYGFVNGMPYFAYAFSLWYGAYLVEHECASAAAVFTIAEALIYGTASAGSFLAYAPDYDKGKIAGARIFKLFDRKPLIDPSPSVGEPITDMEGNVRFEKVSFRYVTRPGTEVLQRVVLRIDAGLKIALVGPSGSGKSTFVALLLRFYDPEEGVLLLDGNDVKTLNLFELRSKLSIVQQEPILFDSSIADNIAYGDLSRNVGIEEIIDASRKANAHNFIISLPSGYDTRVGAMGNQISGGQKQRIAIARALLKSPKLLILDECTSALDTESEKIVQEALDIAQAGRTSITIAHRLSSIKDSDRIFVMKDGSLLEVGNHEELLLFRGLYYDMWNSQRKPKKKRH